MWMLLLIIVVLALLGVLGAVIEGLFWLLVVALVLLAIAVAFGWFKVRSTLRRRTR